MKRFSKADSVSYFSHCAVNSSQLEVFPPLPSFISQLTSSSERIQYSVCCPAMLSVSDEYDVSLHPLCRPSRSYRTTPSCLRPAASPPSWERLCPRCASSSTESTHISENTLLSISTSHVIYLHTTWWGEWGVLCNRPHHRFLSIYL